jgi:FkbM family methyltransferase
LPTGDPGNSPNVHIAEPPTARMTAPSRIALTRARVGRIIGLNVHARGTERVIRRLIPPGDRKAYVAGTVRALDGTLFHVDTRSLLEWALWVFGGFELDLQETMRRWLRAGDVAVDVGANVGIHTCAIARHVGPRGTVIAIEPLPELAQRLQANCELNGLRNVVLVTKAASSSSGHGLLFPPVPGAVNRAQGSLYRLAGLAAVPWNVELETVDAILLERGIDRLRLVKIDVEGHELAVLSGMEQALRLWRPYVLFEFHPDTYRAAGAEWAQVRDLFEAVGGYDLRRHSQAGELRPLAVGGPQDQCIVAALPETAPAA